MTKPQALLGSTLFLALAPGSITALFPYLLGLWAPSASLFATGKTHWPGILLILLGAPLLLDSFARFALQGLGTPAPIAPPTHLVVTGLYRHVRNPMYVAIFLVLSGEFLLTGTQDFLLYTSIVCLGFHLFVILYEEPTLKTRFGQEYDTYKKHVPRWIPRLIPWKN